MTRNQIAYWEHKENVRHNIATEKETNRSNVVKEKETSRHNVVTEKETERHNRATELLTTTQLSEQNRHNLVIEQQQEAAQAETARSNLAREANARDQIDLGYANVSLGYAGVAEQARHNVQTEKISLLNLAETQRNNDLKDRQAAESLLETKRANEQREYQNKLDWIYNVTHGNDQLSEQNRHNVTTEQETQRENKLQDILSISSESRNTIESATRSAQNVSKGVFDILRKGF